MNALSFLLCSVQLIMRRIRVHGNLCESVFEFQIVQALRDTFPVFTVRAVLALNFNILHLTITIWMVSTDACKRVVVN